MLQFAPVNYNVVPSRDTSIQNRSCLLVHSSSSDLHVERLGSKLPTAVFFNLAMEGRSACNTQIDEQRYDEEIVVHRCQSCDTVVLEVGESMGAKGLRECDTSQKKSSQSPRCATI